MNFVRKAHILYLMGALSLAVFHFGYLLHPGGMNDGGFF